MQGNMVNIDSIIWKHNGILRELVAQRDYFSDEKEYLKAITKRMGVINLAQRFKLKGILG
jgi:hypothetical protein